MKNATSFIKLWMAILTILFASCRKTESIALPMSTEVNNAAVEKFLTVPANASPELKAIISNLRKAEKRHPFLSQQIQKNGSAAWQFTIARRALFSSTGGNAVSSVSADATPGVYFIPLVDSVSNEVKSVLYCIQQGDSSYAYKIFNKQEILNDHPSGGPALRNGRMILSIFATFERKINHQSTMIVGAPYSSSFQNTDIKFIESPIGNRVQTNAKTTSVKAKTNEADCPKTFHSETIVFQFLDVEVALEFAWWVDCHGNKELIGIFPIGGGSGSGSGGSGSIGGGTYQPGGDWGTFWGGYGGGFVNGYAPPTEGGAATFPGYGSGSTAPNSAFVTDPFGNPANVNTPAFWLTPSTYLPVVDELSKKMPLTDDQKWWLTTTSGLANDLMDWVSADEAVTGVLTQEDINGALIAVEMARRGVINLPNDAAYTEVLSANYPGASSTITPNVVTRYAVAVGLRTTMIMKDNPSWSFFHCYYEATKEVVHMGLSVIGLIPVVGEIADITNGILYSFDGEGNMAALSYLSAVPIVGWEAAAAQMAQRIIVSAGGRTTLNWIKLTSGKIAFGSRTQLRKVLGLTGQKQAHHLIPWEHLEHEVVQTAAKAPGTSAFHMNELANGIGLEKKVHIEGFAHPTYSGKVQAALEEIKTRYASNNTVLTPAAARSEIDALLAKIRTWIENNPGVNLDSIIIP